MKAAAYIAGLLGLALLAILLIHADVPAMLRVWKTASPALLWLVPYRVGYFALYAVGWRVILHPFDPTGRAGFSYLLWVTSVREAVDRLLPVASLGGLVLGVRLLVWRGIGTIPATASVIVEVLLNVFALYIFGTLATLILLSNGGSHREVVMGLVLSLPIAIVPLLLLRYGSVFQRLQRFLKPLTGLAGAEAATALDADLHFCVGQIRILSLASTMQFLALVSGSFEIWWALRLFDHPVSATSAIMLEGLMQAARHLAFIVPAGLGVQEAALVVLGHTLGISTELALAVSVVKRMREIICGVPPLLSWHWLEARRLRSAAGP